MRRELRLRRRKDFDNVFRKGRAWHNELLVLRTLPNALDHNRYGFITSKRVGKAVVRNRVRRRLREAVRVLPLATGWDVVVSAKSAAAETDFHALNHAVTELLTRARLLDNTMGEAPA
jgi:ribonuclease P protein component